MDRPRHSTQATPITRTRISRRAFLAGAGRAAVGTAAWASLPSWARAALAQGASPEMIERNDWPEHWETTLAALGRATVTANDLFFVRSHFPVPKVDLASYTLEVAGLIKTPLKLTLADLKALPQTTATAVLECAGNGRGLMKLANTSGTQWGYGAVGNARWTGVLLSALLDRAEVAPEAQHVWFEAADAAPMPAAPTFLRSIPLTKAKTDVLLAHTMNGAALPVLHGAPLRVVVPGWFGMASTKWVTKVRLEATPSDNHFMAKGYHYVYPDEDPAQAAPVEELRVKSVITRPLDGTRVAPGTLRVQGFAWAGSAGVKQVDVSFDGGATWKPAGFMGDYEPGGWRMFATETEIKKPAKIVVMARATDGAGNVQPAEARPNASGYGNNSIHKVTIDVRA